MADRKYYHQYGKRILKCQGTTGWKTESGESVDIHWGAKGRVLAITFRKMVYEPAQKLWHNNDTGIGPNNYDTQEVE